MCGIAGFYGRGSEKDVRAMVSSIRYRGPDDEGIYIDGNVGLGHARLSIIDLSPAGRQPMSNEDGSVWIAFNGEIYNFQELKKQLKFKHNFQSNTDTEIIIHLYEEVGERVFSYLNGMFAIALFDKKNNTIILARDRMGKKPLYWGIFGNTIIFGSELKALLSHSECAKDLDLESLNKYLLYEYVPTPHTILKNIYKLEPGYYAVYDGHNMMKKCFWDITFQDPTQAMSFEDARNELDSRLDAAVNARLISDVPIGIFLSGGIDSSTIAYYAQKNSMQKIKTYCIGFQEDTFDESSYASQVAEFLHTEHHEKILSSRDSLDVISKICELLDEPMSDPSLIPTFLLSQYTREQVTVALGGDGGDELFCGYDTFVAHRLADIYEKAPSSLRGIIEKGARLLPTSFKNISFDFMIKKFISGFDISRNYRSQKWLGSFGDRERQELFLPDILHKIQKANAYEDIDGYLGRIVNASYYQKLIYLYLRMYMMDDILVKVDRASMYNSLEVRSPMLDYNVVDFANSIPIRWKLHGLTTKFILKKLMEQRLPKEIVYRKKKGFGMPLAEWLLHDLRHMVLDVFSERKIHKQGIFHYPFIQKLIREHFSKKKDNRKLIWTLMIFQLWYNTWYKK